jgi:hypothetical protein
MELKHLLQENLNNQKYVKNQHMNQFRHNPNQILVNPSYILKILTGIAIVLVLASFGTQILKYKAGIDYMMGLIPMFFLGSEANIPTFYSVFLLLLSSSLLLLITIYKRNRGESNVNLWALLAFVFFYISMDEMATIHEKLTDPFASFLGGAQRPAILTFAWVIPVLVVLIFLGILYIRFFLKLDKRTKLHFFIAATLMIGGAIGFELIGGYYFRILGDDNLTYRTIQNTEEMLEISGILVFIKGLLDYCTLNLRSIHFLFGHGQSEDDNTAYYNQIPKDPQSMKVLNVQHVDYERNIGGGSSIQPELSEMDSE